jgi:hypothetical protein
MRQAGAPEEVFALSPTVTIQVQTESWQDRIMMEWTTNSVLGHGLLFMILSCRDSVIYVNSHLPRGIGTVAQSGGMHRTPSLAEARVISTSLPSLSKGAAPVRARRFMRPCAHP